MWLIPILIPSPPWGKRSWSLGQGCREEGKCLLCVDFPEVLWLVNQKGLGGQILFGSSQHLNLLRQEWLKPERGVLYQVSPDHCVAWRQYSLLHLWRLGQKFRGGQPSLKVSLSDLHKVTSLDFLIWTESLWVCVLTYFKSMGEDVIYPVLSCSIRHSQEHKYTQTQHRRPRAQMFAPTRIKAKWQIERQLVVTLCEWPICVPKHHPNLRLSVLS